MDQAGSRLLGAHQPTAEHPTLLAKRQREQLLHGAVTPSGAYPKAPELALQSFLIPQPQGWRVWGALADFGAAPVWVGGWVRGDQGSAPALAAAVRAARPQSLGCAKHPCARA